MIGHIQGEVLFSDGAYSIILTNSGVGYEVAYNKVMAEGSYISLYISQIFKETSQDMFGFNNLREKKLFELLITVKGVGPKSAYALMSAIRVKDICNAIQLENKKVLTSAPGVGPKAAAQIILDLSNKIHTVMMVSSSYKVDKIYSIPKSSLEVVENEIDHSSSNSEVEEVSENEIIQDTIMACKELGFSEEKIIPLAQTILSKNEITKAEQLVHLVLKGM